MLTDPARAHETTAWQETIYQQQETQWHPEWVCLRCNTSLQLDHALLQQVPPHPRCPHHGRRTLVVDLPRAERGGYAHTDARPFPSTTAQQNSSPHHGHTRAKQKHTPHRHKHSPPAHGQPQFTSLPPAQQAPGPTNSWFFVPLLPLGARRLHPDAEHRWASHAFVATEWQHLVQQLREAPPIPWQQLHHALATLQHIAAQTGTPLPPAEAQLTTRLERAGSSLPTGALIHYTWAYDLCLQHLQPSGYIPATAQETLLQTFLGERQAATAASLANHWRQPAEAPHTGAEPQRPQAQHSNAASASASLPNPKSGIRSGGFSLVRFCKLVCLPCEVWNRC